jgi:hypothetical protein
VKIVEKDSECSESFSSEINKQLNQIQNEESNIIGDQNLTHSEIEGIHNNL